MSVSSAYLAEQLEQKYQSAGRGNLSEYDGYLRPFFYCKKQQWGKSNSQGRACVIQEKQMEELVPEDGIFYIICLEKEENASSNLQLAKNWGANVPWICLVAGTYGAPSVLNELQQVFDDYEKWERNLDLLLAEHAGMNRILEEAYGFLQDPISVIDPDLTLLGETGRSRLPEGARLFGEKGINTEYMNALMQDEQYQKLAETRGCVLFPAYISGCRSLNRNLYVEGQVVGRIVLTECDLPLTPGTVCLLETLAIRLEYLMAHEFSANEAGDMEQIFVRILSDRTADPIQISHQLSSLGWKGDQEYLCLVLQITYLNQKQLSTKAICRYLKRQFPDAVSFLYEEEIVTFFNLSRLQMTEEEVGEKLVYFIRDSYLKAGYSRTLQGHMRLRRQYIQAQLALDVGGRRKPYLWIHHFNQIALPYILEQATRRLPGSMLCHEGLLRLKESDEKNHTEYVKTLKAYLEEKQSATQAARCLFIHRSTFLYRMERIQEILQSELDDPEEIFYLELSLRLLEQEEKREANKK